MNNNNNSFNINNNYNNVNNLNKATIHFFRTLQRRIKLDYRNLTVIQKIIILIIFVVLPLTILVIWLRNTYLTNYELAADYEDLILNTLPFLTAISISNTDYFDFYKLFLTQYYPNKISNNALKMYVSNTNLTDQLINQYTYSFWIYVTGSSEGLTSYVNNKLYNDTNVNRSISLTNYTWTNFRYGRYKEIFHRGDSYTSDIKDITTVMQYPGFWLGPEMNNIYIMLSNGAKNENFLLENIELNKWVHIGCTLKGNSIGIYRNGRMEYSSYTNGTLYSSSIKTKNIYFLGNTSENTGFPGYINEFKFYNRILTPENINLLYKQGLRKFKNLNKKVTSYIYSSNSNNTGLLTNNSVVYSSTNSSLNCNSN